MKTKTQLINFIKDNIINEELTIEDAITIIKAFSFVEVDADTSKKISIKDMKQLIINILDKQKNTLKEQWELYVKDYKNKNELILQFNLTHDTVFEIAKINLIHKLNELNH